MLSAIYWRNTWKYQARGYRHLFWDSGTMLANALAVGDTLGLAPALITGFVDDAVNRLLGLDPEREAALELLALGPAASAAAAPAGAPPALAHDVMPLSGEEVDYPALREIHRASGLATPADVLAWRRAVAAPPRQPRGSLVTLPEPTIDSRPLGEAIQRRARRVSSARRRCRPPSCRRRCGRRRDRCRPTWRPASSTST